MAQGPFSMPRAFGFEAQDPAKVRAQHGALGPRGAIRSEPTCIGSDGTGGRSDQPISAVVIAATGGDPSALAAKETALRRTLACRLSGFAQSSDNRKRIR